MWQVNNRGERNPAAVLNWEIVDSMRYDYDRGIRPAEIKAKHPHVNPHTVEAVLFWKTWVRRD